MEKTVFVFQSGRAEQRPAHERIHACVCELQQNVLQGDFMTHKPLMKFTRSLHVPVIVSKTKYFPTRIERY